MYIWEAKLWKEKEGLLALRLESFQCDSETSSDERKPIIAGRSKRYAYLFLHLRHEYSHYYYIEHCKQ